MSNDRKMTRLVLSLLIIVVAVSGENKGFCENNWVPFTNTCLREDFETDVIFFCSDYLKQCEISHRMFFDLRSQKLRRPQPDPPTCQFYAERYNLDCPDNLAKNFYSFQFCDDMFKYCGPEGEYDEPPKEYCELYAQDYVSVCYGHIEISDATTQLCDFYGLKCLPKSEKCIQYEPQWSEFCDKDMIEDKYYRFCSLYSQRCHKALTGVTKPIPRPPLVPASTFAPPIRQTIQPALTPSAHSSNLCRDLRDEYETSCLNNAEGIYAYNVPNLCNTFIEKCSPSELPPNWVRPPRPDPDYVETVPVTEPVTIAPTRATTIIDYEYSTPVDTTENPFDYTTEDPFGEITEPTTIVTQTTFETTPVATTGASNVNQEDLEALCKDLRTEFDARCLSSNTASEDEDFCITFALDCGAKLI